MREEGAGTRCEPALAATGDVMFWPSLGADTNESERHRHRERMAEIEAQRSRQYRPLMSWPHPDPNVEAWAKGLRAAELEHESKACDLAEHKPDLVELARYFLEMGSCEDVDREVAWWLCQHGSGLRAV